MELLSLSNFVWYMSSCGLNSNSARIDPAVYHNQSDCLGRMIVVWKEQAWVFSKGRGVVACLAQKYKYQCSKLGGIKTKPCEYVRWMKSSRVVEIVTGRTALLRRLRPRSGSNV